MSFARFLQGHSDVHAYETDAGTIKIHVRGPDGPPLPFDGAVYEEVDQAAAGARLKALQAAGYVVPEQLVTDLLAGRAEG